MLGSDERISTDEQFGAELRLRFEYILRSRDITPADLARSARLPSANLIYNFLSGRSRSLRPFTIRQICKALGMSMGALLDDDRWQGRSKDRRLGHLGEQLRAAGTTTATTKSEGNGAD